MGMARPEIHTTTVRMPQRLYAQALSVIEKEKSAGKSRRAISLNDLIVSAVAAYLKAHQRRRIDAAFAGMARDVAYQREAKRLIEEFEPSDWEALRLGEEEGKGELL